MKLLCVVVVMTILVAPSGSIFAQSSVGSMAEFKKKQDDGIADAVRMSQERARAGRLSMGSLVSKKGGKLTASQMASERPAVIRIGVHSTQTGHDNRRQTNVR